MHTLYRRCGFRAFALPECQKKPMPGVPLFRAEQVPFSDKANIGLFLGSRNQFAVIDADSPQAVEYITGKLQVMGLYDWLTIVRTPTKKGLHFWVRLERPDWVKVFYRLSPVVGDGEFRLRFPAYVVAPPSRVDVGAYTFLQGGIEQFGYQPLVKFFDIASWLVKPDALVASESSCDPLEVPAGVLFNPRPKVLELFSYLVKAKPGVPVPRINYSTGAVLSSAFRSRSEAEAALISGLVMSGWSYDKVKESFERESPGHYKDQPNQEKYLVTSYNNAVRYVTRLRNSNGQQVVSPSVLAPNHL